MRIRVALLVGAAIAVAGCSTVYREAAPLAEVCRGGSALDESACMLATGQPTYVEVPRRRFGRAVVQYTVQATTPRTREAALADLEACEAPARALQEPGGAYATLVLLFSPAPVAMWQQAELAHETTKVYRACMEPRGYVVNRWQPTREGQ